MRHGKKYRHLSRSTPHRLAMFANMAASLLKEERIRTTDAKAKELRSIVEKLITHAKVGAKFAAEAQAATLEVDKKRLTAQAMHKRRTVARVLRDGQAVQKLFGDIQARFATRPGGYTRILKLGTRIGDAAPISIIELVERRVPEAASTAEKAAE